MKKHRIGLAQTLRRIVPSVGRRPNYKHNPLLILNLGVFNFQRPLMLEFPGERLPRSREFAR
jgi:hypothetical protein